MQRAKKLSMKTALTAIVIYFLLIAGQGLQANTAARAELMAGQTINGVFTLSAFAVSLKDEDGVGAIGPAGWGTFGGAMGLYSSLNLPQKSPNVDRVLYINSVIFWNTAQTALFQEAFGLNNNRWMVLSMASASSTALAANTDPGWSAGQTSFINSAGFWGAIYAAALPFVVVGEYDEPIIAALMGSLAGLLGGSLWEDNDQYSRRTVWRNDGLGLVGGLLGATFGALFILADGSPRWVAFWALVGVTWGMIAGYQQDDAKNSGSASGFVQKSVRKVDRVYSMTLPGLRW